MLVWEMFWHILKNAWHKTQKAGKQALENVLQLDTNTSGTGVHFLSPSLIFNLSSLSLQKLRLHFKEIKIIQDD